MVKIITASGPSHRKSLVFGPSRSGKTTFLGTAMDDPRTAPIIVLDFENGSGSLEGSGAAVVQVQGWQDVNEVYELLSDPKAHEFKSVGIDSSSEAHIYSLLEIMSERAEAAKTDKSVRADLNAFQQDDFGKSLNQMRRFLRAFRALPMHVFVTSLGKLELEPRVGYVWKPGLQGQMAEEIVGMFETAVFLTQSINEKTKEKERLMILGNNPSVRAGVRAGWKVTVPDEITDPTVTKLFDALGVKEVVST